MLAERGLGAALEALALAAPVPVELRALPDRRLPEPVEAAAYYVVAEALANVQKHAGASGSSCARRAERQPLVVEVADDGVGGADEEGERTARARGPRRGARRARSSLDSPAGGGTRLAAAIPLA